MLRRLFATGTLLLLAAAGAFAQFPAGMQLPNVEYNPLLLINPSVQKELKITPAAAGKLQQTFLDEAQRMMPALMGGQANKKPLTQAQRTKITMAGIDHMQSRLAALLTPPQRVRLRQLTLQSIGAAATLQPKVAQQLGLSTAQKSKLTEAISDANERLADQLKGRRTAMEWKGQMAEMTRLQSEAKTQGLMALRATLTPTQQVKWKAMLGKPFNLSGFLGVGNFMGQ